MNLIENSAVNTAMVNLAAGIIAGAPKLKPEEVASRARQLLVATVIPPSMALLAVAAGGPLFNVLTLIKALGEGQDENDDRHTEGELAGRAAALLLNDPTIDAQFGPPTELELVGSNDGPGRLQDLTSALFYVLREIGRVERSQVAADAAAAESAAAAAAAAAAVEAAASAESQSQ